MLTAVFPSGVLGPVDFCELRRLASNCFSVAISLSLILTNKAKLNPHRQECLCFKANLTVLLLSGTLSTPKIARETKESGRTGVENPIKCFVLNVGINLVGV